jgi:hemerythrin-like metal-binding protein
MEKGLIMKNLQLSEVYLVGDELLDAQHKVILSYMAKIRAYFLLEKKDKDLLVLVDRLETFCKLHLWDEEKVMDEMHFPEIEEHKVQHALFLTHLENFTGRYEELNTAKKIDELNFLKAWFLEHIEGADRKYAEFNKKVR